jgi:hypothetical protein
MTLNTITIAIIRTSHRSIRLIISYLLILRQGARPLGRRGLLKIGG